MEIRGAVLPPLTPALLQSLMRMTREELLQWISDRYRLSGEAQSQAQSDPVSYPRAASNR